MDNLIQPEPFDPLPFLIIILVWLILGSYAEWKKGCRDRILGIDPAYSGWKTIRRAVTLYFLFVMMFWSIPFIYSK